MKKKVLITGCNGFLGNKIAEYYILKGEEVYGIDYTQAEPYNKCTYFYKHNLEVEDMTDLYRQVKPDIFIHCAGNASVGKSVEYPELDFNRNVGLLYKTLSAINRANINPRCIFLSSAAVYGNPIQLPISEKEIIKPISPYGLHKSMCENLCQYFKYNHGISIKIARIFSAYGEGLNKQILWDIAKKYKYTGEIELYGMGSETRDFLHVDDIVIGIDKIIEDNSSRSVFNVASGKEIRIDHLATEYVKALNLDVKLIKFNQRTKEGDPLHWRADIKCLESLGFKQQISLEEGLRRYAEWIRSI